MTRVERLRNYLCTNQRRLHRRFVRYIAVAIFCLSLLTNLFHLLSWNDRKELRKEALLSRQMLDARARIQITLIRAACRGDEFTGEQLRLIRENWTQAQYGEVSEIADCVK